MPQAFCLDGVVSIGDPPQVSVLDHGFLYGDGLFETMRACKGQPFLLERHLRRLQQGAEVIGLGLPPEEELRRHIRAALEAAGEPDAYVRLTVTRGPGAASPDPRTCPRPTVFVAVRPFPGVPERWAREGVRTVTSTVRRNEHSPLSRVKSCNYLDCILAKEEAKAHGADEAIMLNTAGNIAEATAWNVFVVRDGVLLTPPPSEGLLPGITRGVVLQLAASRGVLVREEPLAPGVFEEASEAFLTNSLHGMAPLGQLDGAPIGALTPGPMTERLRALYEERRLCGD